MNSAFERLTGTWYCSLEGDPTNYLWFRILPDGRYVGFCPITFNGPIRFQGYRLYLSPESPGVMRVRVRSADVGHLACYRFAGEFLYHLLRETEGNGKTSFKCRPVSGEELPDWFEERFSESLAKPWL